MDTKKFLTGTIAGTVTGIIVGFLVYGLALHNYMASNTMAGVGKEQPDFLWLILGNLFLSALITYIFLKWAGISTLMGGLTGGLTIGLLASLGTSCIAFATSNIYTGGMATLLVDIIAWTVIWAACGAVIGVVLGIGKKE